MLSRADVHEPYEKYSYFIGEEHSDCFVRAKHTSFFFFLNKKGKRVGMNVLILLSCALARLGALSDFCYTITNTYSDSLVCVCTQTVTLPQKC